MDLLPYSTEEDEIQMSQSSDSNNFDSEPIEGNKTEQTIKISKLYYVYFIKTASKRNPILKLLRDVKNHQSCSLQTTSLMSKKYL